MKAFRPMTADSRQQISQIFHKALTRDPKERSRFSTADM